MAVLGNRFRSFALVAIAMSAPALLAAGCDGDEVDTGRLEEQIAQKLDVQVSCPDQDWEEGKQFTCVGAAPGSPTPDGSPRTTNVLVTLGDKDTGSASFQVERGPATGTATIKVP
jgi:hypothetical protein